MRLALRARAGRYRPRAYAGSLKSAPDGSDEQVESG
jgi:hypothetical protein